MELLPLKSRLIKPKDDLFSVLEKTLKRAGKKLHNGDILVIASKVISVSEHRIVECTSVLMEAKIAKQEADIWLGGKPYPFAIKNGVLIPRSGIDSSNSEKNTLILWSKDFWKSAELLRKKIMQQWKLKKFGIVISDSTCRPLRWGVSGIALAWSGFEGVEDYRGKKDLFGKKLKVTRKAVADSLAAAAGMLMGEASEKIPFVLVRDSGATFTAKTKKPKHIQPKEDLFYPIYNEKIQRVKI